MAMSGCDLNYLCPHHIVQNLITWSHLRVTCEVSSSSVQAGNEAVLQGISTVCASSGHNVSSLIYLLRFKLSLFYQ